MFKKSLEKPLLGLMEADPTLGQGQHLRSFPALFSVILHHSKSSITSLMTLRGKYEKHHKNLEICDDFGKKALHFGYPNLSILTQISKQVA